MAELYNLATVSRIFGLSESRLRSWDRTGFLRPSGRLGDRRMYTFQDLVGIRAAKGLLESGLSVRRVRRGLESIRDHLVASEGRGGPQPLTVLRIRSDGQSVVVRDRDAEFDAETGQLLLDFDVRSVSEQVVRTLAPREARGPAPRSAYEWYLVGCRLDEDEATWAEAERAYRRAIELDPQLSHAYTNLGNLRYRVGATAEARTLYERALFVDPAQPEAHYNLGFLCYEAGQAELAVPRFQRALSLDPRFADAHFNLALALSETGRGSEARVHWRKYLDIDPRGPWAEIARRHLRISD